jgi:nucleotide-binding universal stress UspA family protein
MAFQRILCPTDFSPPARAALGVAADLARASAGKLILLHVWQDAGAYALLPEGAIVLQSLAVEIPAEAERQLAEWKRSAEQLGAPSVVTRLVEGPAWARIVEAVAPEGADLIVMGTHGRTGLKHALIGSVAEKVVRHASCPVLVTRTEGPGQQGASR